ncbi:helix-turn-helix transcriptional regulator [bacterium]|nr:helix-turn-helix transcriptional regulator [bacterium]
MLEKFVDLQDTNDVESFDSALKEFTNNQEKLSFRNYLKDEYIFKLRDCRIKSNLTQSQLADMLDCEKQHISRWETDKTFPNMTTLKKISSVLDIELYDTLLISKA